jgi:hypothetical protein
VGELGNLLNLGAQSADVNIHGSDVHKGLAFPDAIEHFVARNTLGLGTEARR